MLYWMDPKGYTCVKTISPGCKSTWMPAKFQAAAQADMANIKAALSKMTKAEIKEYLTSYHGIVYPFQLEGTKADLATKAQYLQIEKLYPHVESDYSDK